MSCPKEVAALEGYVGAMQDWVDHVKKSEPIDELIPVLRRISLVEVPPSLEYAEMLEGRLEFIKERILPEMQNELYEPPSQPQ